MQLTDDQKKSVSGWIAEGAKLSEVQQRLEAEFGIRLTYMEARFLVDDLKLVPKDPAKEVPKTEDAPSGAPGEGDAAASPDGANGELPPTPGSGKVSVSLDKIVRPGALVSGKVVFSDGVVAEWYLDQTGRFGLVPPTPGYRPAPEDLTEFRVLLEAELARQGI